MGHVKKYADELAAGNSEKILSNNPITLSESKPLAEMDGTDVVTKDNLLAGGGKRIIEVPFNTSGILTINWQTDLIPGSATETFADALGNYLYYGEVGYNDGSDNFINAGTKGTPNRPTSGPNAGLLQTVTFDLGPITVSGVITF